MTRDSKGKSSTSRASMQGVKKGKNGKETLKPWIINRVEIKFPEDEMVALLAMIQETQAEREKKAKEEKEKLINKAEKIALSAEKVKAKKTSGEEIFKELEKLSPFEDEVVKPSKKKRKVTMKKKVSRKQFAKR
ncbi:protein MNN4-like [Cucumis melo var. makuwa]|uniref:Protein MNN4-like n=1 Tax=Cucumis melo var. makuwa TaxID=1194695 RepID=A0A5D3DI15_CUCMM|nr:protein MNN4-like [Cucumis melo var. makuwa]